MLQSIEDGNEKELISKVLIINKDRVKDTNKTKTFKKELNLLKLSVTVQDLGL